MQPESAIVCERVWKIFGDKSDKALEAARGDGLSKDEIFERFECVVGVADVDFSVRHGEIFCVMGLSGSGKSTLIRHINRLIEPSAGRILVYGEDVNRKSHEELRRMRAEKMGMVFQHMALFPHRTVRDNVAFGLEIPKGGGQGAPAGSPTRSSPSCSSTGGVTACRRSSRAGCSNGWASRGHWPPTRSSS